MKGQRLLVSVVGPAVALVFAFGVAAVALILVDIDPLFAYGEMIKFGRSNESLISMLNRAVPLYVSALAVAVGFKMGLFNIGVEGQYLLAALFAGFVGGLISLPAVIHVLVILTVAIVVGSLWAGLAGYLKVKRGVHEVISTIMLNFVAFSVSAYLFLNVFSAETTGLTIATKLIPPGGRLPSLNPLLEALGMNIRSGSDLHGFLFIAIALGVGYHYLVNRSRFGYDLRASGINPSAARVAGIDPNKMVLRTMLISGGIAGLVGMSQLLGFFHQYPQDFPRNLGFNGIAVALLGRNHPVGMAFGALLFGFMERASLILDLRHVPRETVTIIQGVVVLAVVIAYEVISRLVQKRTVAAAARAAAAGEVVQEASPT